MHDAHIAESTAKIADLTANIDAAQRKLEILNREKSIMLRSKSTRDPLDPAIVAAYDTDRTALTAEIQRNRDELNTAQRTKAENEAKKTAIETRKNSLTARIAEIKIKFDAINIKLNGGESDEGIIQQLTKAKTDLTKAIANKRTKEQKYVSDLESILSEAIVETMSSEFEKTGKLQAAADESAIKNAKTELERNLINSMKDRYLDGTITDWATFEADYPIFIGAGVDPIITTILPTGTTLDQFRTSNPEEYKKISEEITKELLRLRMRQPREGGRLTRLLGPKPVSEADILAMTTRIGDEGFKTALAENKALRDAITAADKDKVLNIDGKITEGIKKLPMGKILLILAALLGIGIFKGAGS